VKDIRTMNALTERIQELEMIEARQLSAIKIQARDLSDSLRPSSLLKNTFSDLISSKNIRNGALNASVGLGTGWLLKKILTPRSKNTAKPVSLFHSIAGKALQIAATTLISKKLPKFQKKAE